jgi:hypothetical protein
MTVWRPLALVALVAQALPLAGIRAVAAEPVVIGPNLVANGDFSQPDAMDANRPMGWARPDGLGVCWKQAPVGTGKVIWMDTSVSEKQMMDHWAAVGITDWNIPKATGDPVAATYGLSYYSQAFPIEPGKAYRVSVAFHGAGAKIWVRGYGLLTHGDVTESRRLYEAVAELTPSGSGWAVTTHDFNPTKHTPKVTEMKVMLFGYWPAGVKWFKDVAVQALSGDPADAAPK